MLLLSGQGLQPSCKLVHWDYIISYPSAEAFVWSFRLSVCLVWESMEEGIQCKAFLATDNFLFLFLVSVTNQCLLKCSFLDCTASCCCCCSSPACCHRQSSSLLHWLCAVITTSRLINDPYLLVGSCLVWLVKEEEEESLRCMFLLARVLHKKLIC